jgi:hypothetical protein
MIEITFLQKMPKIPLVQLKTPYAANGQYNPYVSRHIKKEK